MKSKAIGRDRDPNSEFSAMLEQNLENQASLSAGTPATVTVINIKDKDFIFVKSTHGQGMIRKEEMLNDNNEVTVNPGERIDAFFEATQHGEKIFTTRPSGAARESVLQNALREKIPLTGKVARKIKGGYEVSLGDMTAFCPGSMMEGGDDVVGRQVPFIIVEVQGKRVIASHRAYREIEKEKQRDLLQGSLKEGDVLTGTVVSLQNFGAFVDLGGVEGLVPVSEISFKRIHHPKEALKTGQEVRVQALKIDWKEDRITLSIRALLENPWQGKLPFDRGDIVEGEIDSIKHFGLFVKLPDHFNGLVPISESGVPRGQKLEGQFEKGQKLNVMVQNIDRENEKISLSIKNVQEAQTRREYEEYMEKLNEPSNESVSSFGKQLMASLEKKKDKQG